MKNTLMAVAVMLGCLAQPVIAAEMSPWPTAEELAEFWSWKYCPIRHVGMTLCINGRCVQTTQNVEIYSVCYFEWLRYFEEMRAPQAGS